MINKVGRNDPCPCGSGLKYKKCHGNPLTLKNEDTFSQMPYDQGLIVKDYTKGKEEIINLGSPGVAISSIVMVEGTTKNLNSEAGKYTFVLNVDVPFLLPLTDGEKYSFFFENAQYVFFHVTKKRGEEFYSTLDSSRLPYFSSMQIQGRSFDDSTKGPNDTPKSYRLIVHLLSMINAFSADQKMKNIDKEPRLSYHIFYFENDQFPEGKPFAKATYPYSGLIEIEGPDSKKTIDNESFRIFLNEQLKVQTYSLNSIIPGIAGKSFQEKVFLCVHDFGFYCTQHPHAISKLQEEEIRDLFLVVLKNIFIYAEGEAFNFRGKLDFKIINHENKYEFITGEFKIWRGEQSLKEAFGQAVRFHNSGQEKELFIILFNSNKEVTNVISKTKQTIMIEPEYDEEVIAELIPKGSNQLFQKFNLRIKNRIVPLTVGIVDIYH